MVFPLSPCFHHLLELHSCISWYLSSCHLQGQQTVQHLQISLPHLYLPSPLHLGQILICLLWEDPCDYIQNPPACPGSSPISGALITSAKLLSHIRWHWQVPGMMMGTLGTSLLPSTAVCLPLRINPSKLFPNRIHKWIYPFEDAFTAKASVSFHLTPT